MNFLKKSTLNMVFSGCLGITNLIISIVLSRLLGPGGVGQYQLAISSSTIFAAILTLGVGGSVIYFINHKIDSPEKITTISLKFSIIAGIFGWIIFSLLLYYENYFGHMSTQAKVAIGLYSGLLVVVTIVGPILMADLQIVKYQIASLAPRASLFIVVLVLFLFGKITTEKAWIATAFTQITALLMTIWFLWDKIQLKNPFDWPLLRNMINYGLKLNLSYIVLLLNGEIGLLLIRAFVAGDFSEVGYYRNAISIGAMLLIFNQAIGQMLFAKWSGAKIQERQNQVERVSRVFWAGSVVAMICLGLLARPIILFLYGEKFMPSVTVFQFLLVGAGARFIYNPLFRLFSGSGQPLCTSAVLAVNLVVMGLLMVFLVPSFKSNGAAIAFSVGNIAGLVLSYYWAATRFDIRLSRCFIIHKEDIFYMFKMLRA